VWIDHNSFTDGDQPDSKLPKYFDRLYEQHDGELDITKGADLVTVSWNQFSNHNKVMLIGGQDTAPEDVGKLRVTVHHNDFENISQRQPRVRFGQVHVYDNYYNEAANPAFLYALSVGVSSQIFAQNNVYSLPSTITADKIIMNYKGTAIHSEGDLVNGKPVDLLAVYNAANTPQLSNTVNWTPEFHLQVDPASSVEKLVQSNAGAGHTITE
jgi:pectate lyase